MTAKASAEITVGSVMRVTRKGERVEVLGFPPRFPTDSYRLVRVRLRDGQGPVGGWRYERDTELEAI